MHQGGRGGESASRHLRSVPPASRLPTHAPACLLAQGLATVVFLALPVACSLLALTRAECARAAALAKRRMVAFAVDQQTTLVTSGDRPTVTPPMLAVSQQRCVPTVEGAQRHRAAQP